MCRPLSVHIQNNERIEMNLHSIVLTAIMKGQLWIDYSSDFTNINTTAQLIVKIIKIWIQKMDV